MSDETKRFTLRLDKKIFEQVEQQAQENKRSTSKEIEYILENYLNITSHK